MQTSTNAQQSLRDARGSVLTLEPARYRKGHSVIRATGDGSGFKTALMWAIEKYGGKWVHRSRGYVMPERKAARVFRILQRYERMNLTGR